jgi:hypothetical protein
MMTRMTLNAGTFSPSGVIESAINRPTARQKQMIISGIGEPSRPRLQAAAGVLPISCQISRRTLLLRTNQRRTGFSGRAVRRGTLHQR